MQSIQFTSGETLCLNFISNELRWRKEKYFPNKETSLVKAIEQAIDNLTDWHCACFCVMSKLEIYDWDQWDKIYCCGPFTNIKDIAGTALNELVFHVYDGKAPGYDYIKRQLGIKTN